MSVNGYLIDNEIVFTPSDKTIKSRTSNQTQTLHAPAARCLELLIESKTTVPQAGLYKAGWGEDALKKVSTATYYQCFVNLRKQLREIGYHNELLITVPKEGMRINATIEITPFTLNDIESNPASPATQEKKPTRFSARSLIITGTGCFIIIVILALSLPKGEVNVIRLGSEDYQHYPQLPDCIYVHSVTPSGVVVDRINQFIIAKNLSCQSTGKILIHQGMVRTTVFHCPNNMKCHSVTWNNDPI